MIVNEIFTNAFQGEGRQAGQACTFVRLSRCNLTCNFCDTPYTWAYTERQAKLHRDSKVYDPKAEGRQMSPMEVFKEIVHFQKGVHHLVVISGGEPLLQMDEVVTLIGLLKRSYFRVAIETAGTIVPPILTGVQWNVSPKLESSGNLLEKRFNKKALLALRQLDADFKFVCSTVQDISEVIGTQIEIDIDPRHMWIMPEGTTAPVVLENAKRIAPYAITYGWNLTLRQHVLLYDDERGR